MTKAFTSFSCLMRCCIRRFPPIFCGAQDKALLPELLNGLERWVQHLSLTYVPDASHWLVHERPDLVIRPSAPDTAPVFTKKESYQRLTVTGQNTDFTLDY